MDLAQITEKEVYVRKANLVIYLSLKSIGGLQEKYW